MCRNQHIVRAILRVARPSEPCQAPKGLSRCPGAEAPGGDRRGPKRGKRDRLSDNKVCVYRTIRGNCDIWVFPNNCQDRTAEVARSAGAKVMVPNIPIHSKGDVLQFAFSRLLCEGYDGFVVFDADNLVDPGFLKAANDALGFRSGCGARVSGQQKSPSKLDQRRDFHFFLGNGRHVQPRAEQTGDVGRVQRHGRGSRARGQ